MPCTLAPSIDLGEPLGGPERRFAKVYVQFFPGHYRRNARWSSVPDKLLPPCSIEMDVGGASLRFEKSPAIALNDQANWDNPIFAIPGERAGKDFYVYAASSGNGTGKFVLSNNATQPLGVGFTFENTRKVGGFHCLCVDVGVIAGHSLSGLTAGAVLPASVWDLRHRPLADPEGMVYSEETGKWYQIYLSDSEGGSTYQSPIAQMYTASPIDGYAPGSKFWHILSLGRRRMKLLDRSEFLLVSRGSNQETRAAGENEPTLAGGHSDSEGRRMISNIGLEDCCGYAWQWLRDNPLVNYGMGWNAQPNDPTDGHGDINAQSSGLAAGGSVNIDMIRSGSAALMTVIAEWEPISWIAGRGCSLPLLCN